MVYYQDRDHLVAETRISFNGEHPQVQKNRLEFYSGGLVFEKHQAGSKWVVLIFKGKDGFCRKVDNEAEADAFIAALQPKVSPIVY